jgi:hypothetical protein
VGTKVEVTEHIGALRKMLDKANTNIMLADTDFNPST